MRSNLFAKTPLKPFFDGAGFRLWDVGARGGTDPHFGAFAFAVDAVGFEPDPVAHAELAPSGAWRSETFVRAALGGTAAPAVLNIPEDPAGASFLEHDPAVGRRYGLDALFRVRERIEIETRTMDDVILDSGALAPNLLKLDVEGLELDILRGGPKALKAVVSVKLEAAFLPQRVGQPLAGDLIAFMTGQGFCLADMVDPARWRTRPWATDPYSVRPNPAYSRGRLAQADLVFLREPETVGAETALTAALAAIGLGYFDHGLELANINPGSMPDGFEDAVWAASRRYGRARALQEMRMLIPNLVRLGRSFAGGINVPAGS